MNAEQLNKDVEMTLINGNLGAMNASIELLSSKGDKSNINDIVMTLIDNDIIGTHLYVLWSDICGKDINKMWWLLNQSDSIALIKDASHRQDYSGKELLKPILDNYAN